MKRVIAALLFFAIASPFPLWADSEYSFASAYDEKKLFDEPSVLSTKVITEDSTNIRRDKEVAQAPPPFGYQTAPFGSAATTAPGYTPGLGGAATAGSAAAAGTAAAAGYYETSSGFYAPSNTDSYATATSSNAKFIVPKYYSDGSMGKLVCSAIGLNVKVYEGIEDESLRKGVGHFTFTSAWDGNVSFAGHNRGVNTHFGKIKNLTKGDLITYSTPYGTRTYEVFYAGKISATDFSRLENTSANTLTLITCQEDQPAYRVCVQAREVR